MQIALNAILVSQVTIQDIELVDFANMAIQVQHSEAVAIMQTKIRADEGFELPQGISVDGSKRVFIGETTVECGGHCISAIASGVALDGLYLQASNCCSSRAPALQHWRGLVEK